MRALGGVLVALGGLLMAGMTVLSVVMAGVIANSNDPKATTRFTGSESDMVFMFSVFGLVFFFGLAAVSAGLWQLIFGRRNLLFIWVMLGLGIVFFIIGNIVDALT